MLTLETFSPDNRDRQIGDSHYRICKEYEAPFKWYISEHRNTGDEWAQGRGCFRGSLEDVIKEFNSLSREREIIDRKRR